MFGNAPKALWTRWLESDSRNRISMTTRGLLVEELAADGRRDRLILFETGIGAFFDPALKDRYGVVEDEHVLLASLAAAGFSHEEIDVLVLSHLHFDHAGGTLARFEQDSGLKLLFPNAIFVTGKRHWQRAIDPHPRDRASFIDGHCQLIEESRKLELVEDDAKRAAALGDEYTFHISDGHTPGMLLSEIKSTDGKGAVVFAGDLIPGVPWVHLPITMGYDRFAEQVIDEKQALLVDLISRAGKLFFTHDRNIAMANIDCDEKGKFKAVNCLETLNGYAMS